jgi:transcriptional regulator with XRE-family HTH domain
MYPNLKLQLWKTGVRQNRLARILDVDDTVLSKVINGFREPSRDLRRRIADILECDEHWLFDPAELSSPPVKAMGIAGQKLERS